MRVIGTAGHVDHGKSALVAALTGTHPDRLKEEQAREMTIELGFAWFTLPQGEDVGVVDVPGHRDFIENMLSGVGGIDAVMFVVAADEGVMPQTREHLAILDILQIGAGVIVLTKTDLIDEPEWLDLVEMDVRTAVAGTVLEDAPLVRVSAKTGSGIDALIQVLETVLAGHPPRPDLGRARLPIDRVFTLPGFGTVVTGTLSDGSLRQAEEVEILPQGIRGRVRGLQSHKRKMDAAQPGSRTAVNISGVDVEDIRRGDVLAGPGRYRPTQRVDVHFRLLPDADGPLKHAAEVKFFVGASEVLARVRLLGKEELIPGEEGWLQLDLQQPIVTVRGDRYILRRPSPAETLGGGMIVDPHPARRHRRFSQDVLKKLEALRYGSPADVLFQAALASGLAPLKEITNRARLSSDQLEPALVELIDSGQLIQIEAGKPAPNAELLVCARPVWSALTEKAIGEVRGYHHAYPLRVGMPREELKSRLKLTPKAFQIALRYIINQGQLAERGTLIQMPDHELRFTTQQQAAIDRLLARFAQAPYTPPSVKEAQLEVGEDVVSALIELGQLVQVSPEVVFRKQDYQALTRWVEQHFQNQAELTVAQFRDEFNTSRRYALGFLEHLDALGVTIRSGDARRLHKMSSNR
jgi:selenocysteine-specific elongation factor